MACRSDRWMTSAEVRAWTGWSRATLCRRVKQDKIKRKSKNKRVFFYDRRKIVELSAKF